MSASTQIRAVEVLLVEDNPGDVRLTREALKDAHLEVTLRVARDGAEALEYLQRRGRYSGASKPDLVLLDLNLPKMSGQEVLAIIKKDEELNSIPVLVLSTSAAESDVMDAYGLQANCYIVKPVDLEKFMDVVRAIEQYWLRVARLPEGGR